MAPLRGATLGVLLFAAFCASGVRAEEAFDDPTAPGDVPCIVLNRYVVEPAARSQGQPRYRAEAVIENICGRAMEVHFCFLRAGEADSADRRCFQGPLRPWALASVAEEDAPVRITAPEYSWRFLRR